MGSLSLYDDLLTTLSTGRKCFAVHVDPDKYNRKSLKETISISEKAGVDYFFVGSSLLVNDKFEDCVRAIKKESPIPVVLFPGSPMQVSDKADAILLLSLISGRNPELLIGHHVMAAPALKKSGLELIPTGYMLVDGGVLTSVAYASNTVPIPSGKTDIAASTAMAGEMLGLKAIYLDAGSGAVNPVSATMIKVVRQKINVPLLVGGGISSPEKVAESCRAGADVVVVGNALEKTPALIYEMAFAVHESPIVSPTN